MPSWKKVIVSGSDAILKDLTLSGDISNASGDFTLDIDGDMTLDAGGADIILKNAGTEFGRFKRDTSDFIIKSATNNKDIIFRGVDNSATIDALTLDMSDAGKAIFNTHISGSATATASFGHFTSAGVSTSRITGKSPLVIDSDNFNVDSSGNLTIATDATASFGKISGSIEVARSGFIRNSRFRGRSPIAFDTRESDGTATRIEITGSVYASADITGSYLKVDGFKGNWTNAGNTVADGGTFTTIDIDGGTITGITDLAVADGGTGAGTFTDGGVLLGSGTDAITATAVLTDGQLLIGDNSGDPTIGTLTGTTNQITVTNGAGSITLSLPQSIHTDADVEFDSVTLDDLTATRLVATDGSKKLVSSDLNNWVAGTSNQITVTDDADGTITLSTPQNLDTSADVTFDSVTLDDLTASKLSGTDGSKKIVSINLDDFVAGTTNRITVTDDTDGTITLSTPQDIHT
ncbi:MAG: hypothetical protein CMG08_07610, partial [Candidatus Marinimicrobia bacterium]|nr:hypothetical protein [Candidatus Neomarinimicrobiota bacterium]